MQFARSVVTVILLVTLLISTLIQPAQAGVLETIGDFLSLGANTVREVQEAIRLAAGEVSELLAELQSSIESIIGTLEETYRDNLNITLESVDSLTRRKLQELALLIDSVNRLLQETIDLATEAAKEVLREASLQIRRAAADLEQRLKEVIVVGGETAAFVLDRGIYNAIVLVGLVLLGLGLLLFVLLLFTRKIPRGAPGVLALAFIGVFIAINGALVFAPPVRAYAMTFVGVGLEQRLEKVQNVPRIVDVLPATVVLGRVQELDVWGSSLLFGGKRPSATVADKPVGVKAVSDERIVLDLSGFTAPAGAAQVTLAYDGAPGPGAIVNIAEAPPPPPPPPDLVVTAFSFDRQPVEDLSAIASITVANEGAGPSSSFRLLWRPNSANREVVLDFQVPGLPAGRIGPIGPIGPIRPSAGRRSVTPITPGNITLISPRDAGRFDDRPHVLPGGVRLRPGARPNEITVTFPYTYSDFGSFDSEIVLDDLNTVKETNEGNNVRVERVNVQRRPPRVADVIVTITGLTILDDSDPPSKGAGDMRFYFNIGGQSLRYPSSGTVDLSRGERRLNLRFRFQLAERQALPIAVTGVEEDWPDDDDSMGSIDLPLPAGRWQDGGAFSQTSTNPSNYRIHFRVEVSWR